MRLKRSTDRKTANKATPSGKTPSIANAFGVPSGTQYSCPGATETCSTVCYAGKLERVFKGMRLNMLSNWDMLNGASARSMVSMLDEIVTEFESECDRKDAVKVFRIHHDGDFFSVRYASAWRVVMDRHPNTTFWAYTRSYNVVGIFESVENFTLYLSVDKDNLDSAIETYNANPWVKLAALGKTFSDAKDLLAAMGSKGARCPELNGAIPLISVNGGACVTCGLCVFGRGNVLFASSKS